jgi:small subunit ribosomal protein S8
MDPISDMITRIRNAQAVNRERVSVPFSKLKLAIATLLAEAGYVGSVERRKRKARTAEIEYLDIALKYTDGVGAISGLRMISSPSRHIYIKSDDIKPVRSGYGMAVVSTPRGVMTSMAARKERVGGEVLFEIW